MGLFRGSIGRPLRNLCGRRRGPKASRGGQESIAVVDRGQLSNAHFAARLLSAAPIRPPHPPPLRRLLQLERRRSARPITAAASSSPLPRLLLQHCSRTLAPVESNALRPFDSPSVVLIMRPAPDAFGAR
uniref:Uncharacterized protein n=1 Tax=Plectus sambesii TaxID=2011161 RepID=A0A914WFJ8_9BILA